MHNLWGIEEVERRDDDFKDVESLWLILSKVPVHYER